MTLQFGKDTIASIKKAQKRINPCLAVYGTMPGKKCKDCNRLVKVSMSRTYYKCEMRRMSHSAASDHRVNWNACGKFEERV